jgi:tetratricopeptide (TPR) repeat protein
MLTAAVMVGLLAGSVAAEPAGALLAGGQTAFARGDYATAYRTFLELLASRPGDPEVDFLLGRSAYEIGDYEAAIFAFERVLIAHPESDRARLELGRTCFAIGDFEASRGYFNAVLANDPPLTVRQNIQAFLVRIERAVQRHTLGGMFSLAASYDDNVYASPVEEQIQTLIGEITLAGPTAKPRSDSILQPTLLLNHGYRPRPQGMFWQTSAVTHHAFYRDEDELDLALVGLSSGPVWQTPSWQLALPVSFNYLTLDSERYLTGSGLGAELTWLAQPQLSLALSLQGSRLNYANDDRDAWQYRAELRPVLVVGDRRLSAGFGVEINDARTDRTGYLRRLAALGYEQRLFWGLTGSLGYRLKWTRYEDEEPMFGRVRRDAIHDFSFSLSRPIWRSASGGRQLLAQLQHVITDAQANIDLYEYDKNVTTLTLSLRF